MSFASSGDYYSYHLMSNTSSALNVRRIEIIISAVISVYFNVLFTS